jgi:hypothetical protein
VVHQSTDGIAVFGSAEYDRETEYDRKPVGSAKVPPALNERPFLNKESPSVAGEHSMGGMSV